MPDRSTILLDGEGLDDHELVGICETPSFDGGDRVVVVDNANKVKGTKALTTYIEGKNPQDDSVVLAAIIRTSKISKVWALAASKGLVAEYAKLKPWQEKEQIASIVAEAKRLKLELASEIPGLFIRHVGYDLRQIVNELSKLVYIVGEGGTVEVKHLALVLTRMYPASPWDVADAAAAGNPRKAMTLLSYLYKHMGEGASVPITIGLQSLVLKLIITRQLMDLGEPTSVMAIRLDMHEFPLKKNILPLARRHTVDKLLKQMVELCRLETQVKGSARSKRTRVELAVLSLAA